jgi:hypothetical protein
MSSSIFTENADAQLQRERVVTDAPIDNIFWSGTNIGLSTVTNVSAKNLNTSVLHTFGLTRGGIDRFWDEDFRIGFNINRMFGLSR